MRMKRTRDACVAALKRHENRHVLALVFMSTPSSRTQCAARTRIGECLTANGTACGFRTRQVRRTVCFRAMQSKLHINHAGPRDSRALSRCTCSTACGHRLKQTLLYSARHRCRRCAITAQFAFKAARYSAFSCAISMSGAADTPWHTGCTCLYTSTRRAARRSRPRQLQLAEEGVTEATAPERLHLA